MTQRPFPTVLLGLILAASSVVFFPTLFFDRVASPLDVLRDRPPWASADHGLGAANPDLGEPAATLVPSLIQTRREGLATALWNPSPACGAPGALSWGNGLLTARLLALAPWIGLSFLVNAMVLAKLVIACVGAFLLAHRLGQPQSAAALAAAAYALAGPLTANWLWPSSGTFAALPLLLWAADRTLSSTAPCRSAAGLAAAWLLTLASGPPHAAALAGATVAGWMLWRVTTAARASKRRVLTAAATVALGAAISLAVMAPAIVLHHSAQSAAAGVPRVETPVGWGWSALRLLVDPLAYGDPRQESFAPPPRLEGVPFHDACLSMGWVALALAGLGAASNWPGRWTSVVLALVPLAVLTLRTAARAAALFPGLDPPSPGSVGALAALGLALLAGAGCQQLERVLPSQLGPPLTVTLVLAVVLQQGLLAGHLLTFLPPEEATLEQTPGLELVQRHCATAPSRVAPLLDTLWPETAAAFGLDDVRAQRPPSLEYLRFLQAVDSQVWGHFGSVLRLNAATLDLRHPYLAALGARWVLEPPELRMVEYQLAQQTMEVEPRAALLGPLNADDVATQELLLPAGCSRLGVHLSDQGHPPTGRLRLKLVDQNDGRTVARRTDAAHRVAAEGIAWLDLTEVPDPHHGHRLEVTSDVDQGQLWLWHTVDSSSLPGRLLVAGAEVSGDLALSFDTSGYLVVYEGPDLRVWEYRRALPRFWLVRRLLPGSLDDLLAARPPLDLARVALVAPGLVASLPGPDAVDAVDARPSAGVTITSWSVHRYLLEVEAASSCLLVSSLPAEPALWHARVDGAAAAPVTANGLFLALPIPAGSHRVELEVRLPPLCYVGSACGLGLWLLLGLVALRRTRAPSDTRSIG